MKKALYDLKQTPRAWYNKLDKSFKDLGLNRSNFEPTMYIKHLQQTIILTGVYVDDLLIIGSTVKIIKVFKDKMTSLFEMLVV